MAFSQLWNYIPSVIIFNIFSNLSAKDRLSASATCKTWRDCLYHCSQWPKKSLNINLCKSNCNRNGIPMNGRNHELRRSKHNSNTTLTLNWNRNVFLMKCSRFLNDICITFNPNSTSNLNDLIDIIDILSLNGHYFDNNDNDNNNNNNNFNNNNINHNSDNDYVKNSRCLRRLTLNPINVISNLNNNNNNKNYELFGQLLVSLEQLIERCDSLEHMSFGCLQQLLNHSNSLLSKLAKQHSQSLRCLHLSSVKQDPDYYPVLDLSLQLFEPFLNIKCLTIDFDLINDQLLRLMAKKGTIDTLIINVHGIDEEHETLSKSAWTELSRSNASLRVTVNLIHTDDALHVLRDSLFDTDMPLAHFRAYFVGMFGPTEDSLCHLINLIAIRHSKTLLSSTIVDNLKPFTLMPNPVFAKSQENPLVMLSWRCKSLQSLTVLGYEVCDADLIAITRLRGSTLKKFVFPLCCISLLHSPIAEDEGYYDDDKFYLDGAPHSIQRKVIEDISKPLNREWRPMSFDELPNAVINRYDEMQTTYMSTILMDQNSCGESLTNPFDSNTKVSNN